MISGATACLQRNRTHIRQLDDAGHAGTLAEAGVRLMLWPRRVAAKADSCRQGYGQNKGKGLLFAVTKPNPSRTISSCWFRRFSYAVFTSGYRLSCKQRREVNRSTDESTI